jgi:hypothetical protein
MWEPGVRRPTPMGVGGEARLGAGGSAGATMTSGVGGSSSGSGGAVMAGQGGMMASGSGGAAVVTPMRAPCVQRPAIRPQSMMRLTHEQYARSVTGALNVAADLTMLHTEQRSQFWVDGTGSLPVTQHIEGWADAAKDISRRSDPGALARCTTSDEACATLVVDRVGRRLYRRAPSADERNRLLALYRAGRTGSVAHKESLQMMVEVMLQSPRFLYQVEPMAGLDGLAKAQRLAYSLWQAPPDDALLDLAAQGGLDSPAQVRAQAERMVADARIEAGLRSFHHQWLSTDAVPTVGKLPAAYPGFSPAVAAAMYEQATLHFDEVSRSDRFETIFSNQGVWVNRALQPVYPSVTMPASGWYRLPLPAANAAGALTLPAVMAVQGNPASSSPIKRGLFVLTRLFCETVGPPTGLVLTSDGSSGATTRQQVESQTASPTCQGCHNRINPPGFALEHYDGMGAFRSTENGLPIDASGGVVGLPEGDLNGVGAGMLGQALAHNAGAQACYVKHWLNAVNGPGELEKFDSCGTEELAASMRTKGLRGMLVDMVSRPDFMARR